MDLLVEHWPTKDSKQHLVVVPEAEHNHQNSDSEPVAVAAVERNLQSREPVVRLAPDLPKRRAEPEP